MKLLIADDDRISLKMLGRALEQKGYEVISAEDGEAAYQMYQAEEIHLAILDLEMPGRDGIALCRQIREVSGGRYCYIMMMTAKIDFGYLKEAFEAGADDYICKPFNLEEIAMRLKTGERIVNFEAGHVKMSTVLRESRNKFKAVFDSLSDEIVVLDGNLSITFANKAFIDNRGLEYVSAMGMSFPDLDRNLFNEESQTAVQAVFSDGKPRNFLVQTTDAAGEAVVKDITCLPVSDSSDHFSQVVFTSKDITEKRKKTDSIRRLNDDLNSAMAQVQSQNKMLEDTLSQLKKNQSHLLQSEKMASIGQLAAGVAHEINNPTGYVSSNLKTLKSYIDDLLSLMDRYRKITDDLQSDGLLNSGGRLEAFSEIIEAEKEMDIEYLMEDLPGLIRESREGIDRIKKIVSDLKDFAHPEDDEQKFADINACIDSTLNIVWSEIKYKAKLEKRYGNIPPLLCYPRQLNQAFMNLLVNAAQAIPEQGRIDIHTEVSAGKVRIVISDNGCGIPPENATKIFDPFFTTKPVGKGTGLGLHLVYNIVSKHNGTISVESTVGKGTSFSIEIPIAVESREPQQAEAAG